MGRTALSVPTDGIWAGVVRLIGAQRDVAGLRHHGLGPLAAAYAKEFGWSIDAELRGEREAQTALSIEAELTIRNAREAIDGPLLLLKGLDVGARYPAPDLRRIRDVDVLVPDAAGVQAALLARGWRAQSGDGVALDPRSYDDLHQLCPLESPALSLPFEVHRAPHWPSWGTPPEFVELFGSAEPSVVGIEGVVAPCVEHQALLVLAHSWARQPFEQLSQLLDFALLAEEADAVEMRWCAKRWELARLLDIGRRAVDSLLLGLERDDWVLRTFAPHLRRLTVPTTARQQLNRYLAAFAVTEPRRAVSAATGGVMRRSRTVAREMIARTRQGVSG
jgi:hypothetical protein